MIRREFLKALSALPFLGFLKQPSKKPEQVQKRKIRFISPLPFRVPDGHKATITKLDIEMNTADTAAEKMIIWGYLEEV